MKPTQEEVKARLDHEAEKRKRQEWHGEVWRPTITDQERKERQYQIDRGILPF